jgi:hypothetical protein
MVSRRSAWVHPDVPRFARQQTDRFRPVAFWLRSCSVECVEQTSDESEREIAALWEGLFVSHNIEEIRAALQGAVGSALLDELTRSVDAALQGDEASTRRYVDEFERATRRVLYIAVTRVEAFHTTVDPVTFAAWRSPDWEAGVRSHGLWVPGGPTSRHEDDERATARLAAMWTLTLNTSVEAPLSPWSAVYGTRDGLALHLLARMRFYLPETEPLAEPREPRHVIEHDPDAVVRFVRSVRLYLDTLDEPGPLEGAMRAFDLDTTTTAQLFGVSRQAVARWLREGRVPAERQAKAAALASVADLLERKLKRGRLPGIARRSADAYGGLTMLEMVAADRHEELLRSVRESFEWDVAA